MDFALLLMFIARILRHLYCVFGRPLHRRGCPALELTILFQPRCDEKIRGCLATSADPTLGASTCTTFARMRGGIVYSPSHLLALPLEQYHK